MAETPQPERFPLFTLLMSLVLAAAISRTYPADATRLADWAPLATVVCLMWLGSRAQAWPLGVFTALLVSLHAAFDPAVWRSPCLGLAQVCLYVGVLCNLAAARLTVLPVFAWRRWLFAGGVLVGATVYAVHLDRLVAAQLAVGTPAFLLVVALAAGRLPLTCRGNGLACLGLALAAPAISAALASIILLPAAQAELLPELATPDWRGWWNGWAASLTDAFLVPGWIAALAILLGWLMAIRRGIWHLRQQRAPVSWGLAVFGWLALLVPLVKPADERSLAFPAQLPWGVLFLGFVLFDAIHTAGERLVLKPPGGDSRLTDWRAER